MNKHTNNDREPQAFEDREELANLIQHAACFWKTDSNWSPLLSEINLVCNELSELQKSHAELLEALESLHNDTLYQLSSNDDRTTHSSPEMYNKVEQAINNAKPK